MSGLGPTPQQIDGMGRTIAARLDGATRRRRRRRIGAGSAIALAALAGACLTASAVAVRSAAPEQIRYAVDCYTVADPRAEHGVVAYFPEEQEQPFGDEFALQQCLRGYAREGDAVPHPTVCELADLRLGVFPNRDDLPPERFCATLGLGPVPEDLSR